MTDGFARLLPGLAEAERPQGDGSRTRFAARGLGSGAGSQLAAPPPAQPGAPLALARRRVTGAEGGGVGRRWV